MAGNALAEGKQPSAGLLRRHARRWILIVSATIVVGPALFLLGAQLGKDPTRVRSPLLGKPAPRFNLPRLDGPGVVASSELSGRLYVVNFWASWCVPCREETAALETFYQRWKPRGVELLGILYSDTADAARKFRASSGGSWPLLDDPGARAAVEHGVFGVPETFVVDQRGIVMAKLVGAVAPGRLEEIVEGIARGDSPLTAENDRYRRTP